MEQLDVTRVCKVCGKELPIEAFRKNITGYTHVCNDCVNAKRKKTKEDKALLADTDRRVQEALQMRLEDFTPRQLGEELKRRGYVGVLSYEVVETKRMDLSKL